MSLKLKKVWFLFCEDVASIFIDLSGLDPFYHIDYFGWCYRIGNALYGYTLDYGIGNGILIKNEHPYAGWMEPLYCLPEHHDPMRGLPAG